MVREELYNKTVDILYQAYFNGTLVHGNCHACAVGNIVAANMGIRVVQNLSSAEHWPHRFGWEGVGNVYATSEAYIANWYDAIQCGKVYKEEINEEIKHQIDSTGYTAEQLAKIENAFEFNCEVGRNDDEWMFNGLVAVLEVIDQIHEVNTEVSQINKSRFSRHYETLIAN